MGVSAVDSKLLELIFKGMRLQSCGERRKSVVGGENIRGNCREEEKEREYRRNNKSFHPFLLRFQGGKNTCLNFNLLSSLLRSECLCPPQIHILKA